MRRREGSRKCPKFVKLAHCKNYLAINCDKPKQIPWIRSRHSYQTSEV